MITGRDTLQVLNEHILQARSEMEQAGSRLDDLNQRLNTLRFEVGEQYRKLAKFRLDEIRANSLISRLEKSNSAILALLANRKKAMLALEQEVKESLARQQELEQARVAQQERCDEAYKILTDQLEQTKARVEQTESYRLQKEKVEQAVEMAERADEKASLAEADRISKGKPYEDDALFTYLWSRHYLTPDYRANRLILSLDGWVARVINFQEARADYHMLTELPLRLRDHATKLRKEADLQVQALQAMEKEAAEQDGVPMLQSAVDEAERRLRQINDQTESEEVRYQKLQEQQADFSAWLDDYSQQAIELQVAELEREEMVNLYHQAQATPSPEDDVIVSRLNDLKVEQKQTTEESKSIKKAQEQHQRALIELEQLRQKFRRHSYDGYHSNFPSTFGLALLLGQLMRGGMSSDSVWGEIKRSQRFRRPPSSGGGGISFGGFGSGGGFGGGGFRTGGSF